MSASLRSARLALRPSSLDDVPALHALWTDPEVRRWLFDDVAISEATARELVVESLASFAERGFGQWAIADQQHGALFGAVGLRGFDGGREVELLYALAPARWGAGLATEAAGAVLAHGFRTLGLSRISARIDTPNRSSVRVIERLGFRYEGEHPIQGRPTLHYSLERGRS